MSGYVAISREAFDHPLFAGEKASKFHAWSWMIAEAAWKPTRVSVNGRWFNLERGQLVHAERYLAEKWKWPKSRVRRFLRRLASDRTVVLKPDRDATLITICNYDKYQSQRTADRTASEPPADRERTKEEPLNQLTKEHHGHRATANALADEIGRLCGHATPHDWPPAFLGAPARIETWLRNGWPRESIIDAVKETLAKKRDGPPENVSYFEKPIAKFIARQSTPLPQYEAQNATDRPANHGKSALAAVRKIRAEIERNGDHAADRDVVVSLPAR